MIQPYILGKGRAGLAIEHALEVLRLTDPELQIQPVRWLERNATPKPMSGPHRSVLFIANPHGLHAKAVLLAHQSGFHGIGCEKPSCVTLEQVRELEKVTTKTAVFHGYRQMWGPQTLKKMIAESEFGDIISIEGRYWQCSTAERALLGTPSGSWKNDVQLTGPSDALLDIGTHWADMAVFFMGEKPQTIMGWASYANSEAAHRDSHIQLAMNFSRNRRAQASVSKTAHGFNNHFEINILGTKKSATWYFLRPDELILGEARQTRVITRESNDYGSKYPAFHGMGWSEGYIEITRQLLRDVSGMSFTPYPTLKENRELIGSLLQAKILNAN